MRLLVARNAQRGVVLNRAREEGADLVLFLLISRLDGNGVLRHRQRQRIDGHRARLRQRVAGTRIGELGNHDDVAGLRRLHIRGLLAHHHVQMAQTILFARARVDQLHTGREHAADQLQVAQTSHERVGNGLEDERRRLAVLFHERLLAIGKAESAVVARVREVGADILHHAADALLDDGGTHVYGDEQLLRDGLVEQALKLFLRELLGAVQILHHQIIVGLCHQVAQAIARDLRRLGVFRRDILDAVVSGAVLIEVTRLHAQHVDDALEVLGNADGDGYRPQAASETRVQLRHDGIEVRVLAIDVVDEHGARQAHALGLAPQLRGHDLGACDGIDDEQRHFGSLHGGKRVADEVGMARGVEQVDLVIMVRNGRDGGTQSELAANLLLVVIKVGFAVVGGSHARRAA